MKRISSRATFITELNSNSIKYNLFPSIKGAIFCFIALLYQNTYISVLLQSNCFDKINSSRSAHKNLYKLTIHTVKRKDLFATTYTSFNSPFSINRRFHLKSHSPSYPLYLHLHNQAHGSLHSVFENHFAVLQGIYPHILSA